MSPALIDQWTRSWTIVSADPYIAHVTMPLSSFRLKNLSPAGKSPQFQVAYNTQAPAPDCFAGAVLTPKGKHSAATFKEITNKDQLLPYSSDSRQIVDEYDEVSTSMTRYMMENPDVERLEGIIMIPCHPHGGPVPPKSLPGHSVMTIKTTVHLYLFPGVVKGDVPLLVLRTPLSPVCPMNGGDGTAIGYGK